jgi:restriction system protein
MDSSISRQVLAESRARNVDALADSQIVGGPGGDLTENFEIIERIRSRLLSMEPRRFELFLRDLLAHTGFTDVCVTKYSADGGVDVNARAGPRTWIFEKTLVQVQAKRWLHSVGRKEIAELRGSLQPHARGAVITTSHFSKAAMNEAGEEGKLPIALIDGYRLSKVVFDEKFDLNV